MFMSRACLNIINASWLSHCCKLSITLQQACLHFYSVMFRVQYWGHENKVLQSAFIKLRVMSLVTLHPTNESFYIIVWIFLCSVGITPAQNKTFLAQFGGANKVGKLLYLGGRVERQVSPPLRNFANSFAKKCNK